MASRPPLQVEDFTDEDFFDKLVDDDFPASEAVHRSTKGHISDETNALTNLSLGEAGASFDESGLNDTGEEIYSGADAAVAAVPVDALGEDGGSMAPPPNSSGLSNVTEPKLANNDAIGTKEGKLDPKVNESDESSGLGVKEVQWSAFNSDESQGFTDGFGSYSDFFSEFGDGSRGIPAKVEENLISEAKIGPEDKEPKTDVLVNSITHEQYPDGQGYAAGIDDCVNAQDQSNSQDWENLYPGWKYDPSSGQWYQVDGFGATANAQEGFETNMTGNCVGSDGNLEVSYLQQAVQSVAGTVTESSTTGSVSSWNHGSQGNNQFPEHMVFDPQYPGWYYDTIAQEWRTLEFYYSSVQHTVPSDSQQNHTGFGLIDTSTHNHNDSISMHSDYGQANYQGVQGEGVQSQDNNWLGSYNNYNQHSQNTWQTNLANKNQSVSDFSVRPTLDHFYGSNASVNNHMVQQKSFDSMGTVPSHDRGSQGNDHASGSSTVGLGYIPSERFSNQYNQSNLEQREQMMSQHDYYGSQSPENSQMMSQPDYYGSQNPEKISQNQFSHASNVGRSSAGRPPHALVTFGFGGKLIVVRDTSSFRNASYGSQGLVGGSISVHNLMEVVTEKTDASTVGVGACNYVQTLCQQSFPGPLVGGSPGSKELNKWIDERIANCATSAMDYRKGEALRLLLSLLKIACQHYGKLRSPFGTDTASKENEIPESAVARLFASAKGHGGQSNAYGAVAHCLNSFPPEGQIQATAAEVQSLLVSGRTKEALLCAQEGQLWGPALVLAAQLGDQFYIDTVKQMALRQLVAGSPLRTICLLIAGKHADVFSTDSTTTGGFSAAADMCQQSEQLGVNVMLDDWEENLAVITANRTKDDELVIIHLGDCLWKERSEIIGAHICYLAAEANFEAYSDTARLCLIGADHWKFPRTFTTPEAIQRTELYEYSKVLGNSQFILLPFQPYKLLYAHMLAEVGKVSDALKYCQAVLKSLKTSRAPDVETWKQLGASLEDRLRTHQQGGFTANLAPGKIVGKILNLFDSTAHRVVGGLPPAVPSSSQINAQENGNIMGPRVSASQSTMTMSSLMTSASTEPMNEWTGDNDRKVIHNRSVSEPDFSRTPRQVDSSKGEASNVQGKFSGSSRFVGFGFGSQFLQKTMGLVLKRSDRQAKLGEKNKFYYDEKLKRWVEEGAEPPAEEPALPPPPTTSFQNGKSDYTLKNALKNESIPPDMTPISHNQASPEFSSGIPPMPPSSNHFSARGRAGVRSRYVDTFNQGSGTPAKLFQSPSAPPVKSAVGASPKFFIPTQASSVEHPVQASAENVQGSAAGANENLSTSSMNESFQAQGSPSSIAPQSYPGMNDSFQAQGLPSSIATQREPSVSNSFLGQGSPSSVAMQRHYPSMDDIPNRGVMAQNNGSFSSLSRRTASWSGSSTDAFGSPKKAALQPLGEGLRMPPSAFMPTDPSLMQLQQKGSGMSDELHEVEL